MDAPSSIPRSFITVALSFFLALLAIGITWRIADAFGLLPDPHGPVRDTDRDRVLSSLALDAVLIPVMAMILRPLARWIARVHLGWKLALLVALVHSVLTFAFISLQILGDLDRVGLVSLIIGPLVAGLLLRLAAPKEPAAL